jgi:hypothetical protein
MKFLSIITPFLFMPILFFGQKNIRIEESVSWDNPKEIKADVIVSYNTLICLDQSSFVCLLFYARRKIQANDRRRD